MNKKPPTSDSNGTPSKPSNGKKTEYHSVQPSSSTDDINIEMKDATIGAEKMPQGASTLIKEVPPAKNENDTTTSSPPSNSSDTAADAEMKDSNAKADVDRKDFNADTKASHLGKPEPKKKETAKEEEEEPTSSLTELWEELSEIDTPGYTCAAGPVSCPPAIPGLHVEGVGDIPLPICDAQVKMLSSVAEQAPHGKGMETIVDTALRNTLQVDPSKVTMKNPTWKASLDKVVQWAAEALGVSPNLVNAELYKLLLYEEGGFYKKHRDTEKAKGMFATLVIQLPSILLAVPLSSVTAANPKSLRWEQGPRLPMVVTSSVTTQTVNTKSKRLSRGRCSPTASDYGHNYLTSVLGRLPADESLFVIPLVHHYTTSSLARLGVGALNGTDRVKQSAIESAGKGKWKMIVAKANRTDYESGDGSCYGRFDVCDVERGTVTLSDAYHAYESDAGDHLP